MVKPTKIDDLHRGSYFHLIESDECYFFGEYAPGAGYAGATNNLILNFKKDMDTQESPKEWRHKLRAIASVSRMLAEALKPDWLETSTLVPMPPSKARHDPMYDDRMCQVLARIERLTGIDLDTRELLYQTETTRSSSRSGERLSIGEIRKVYRLDESLTDPQPQKIALFDDLLTSGAHFKVGKELIRRKWPNMRVFGIFLARSLH